MSSLIIQLERAIHARQAWIELGKNQAYRIFNGFLEGCPGLVVDIYGSTLVLYNQLKTPLFLQEDTLLAMEIVYKQLPWLKAGLVKIRHAATQDDRCGKLLFGSTLDEDILENGIKYALDLSLHQDASFYLDTRNVRKWAFANLRDKSVLNTFAYTGSLGVAAMAGGACKVIHLDIDRSYLEICERSYLLNNFPIDPKMLLVGDYFTQVGRLKSKGELFDCIFLDPPYFSATPRGRFNLNTDSARLINKIRPLVNDGGMIIAINNSIYVSGKKYMDSLMALCRDDYLQVIGTIDVPEDCIGFRQTLKGNPITDPSPFNHSTKIAILKARRKS